MAHDVFISYASEDLPSAEIVCSALENSGISCWIAPRDIPVGSDYAEALLEAVLASRLLVLVFSGNANESSHVVREVDRAVGSKIRVLPLRIEDVPFSKSLEYLLSGVQYFDAIHPSLESRLSTFVAVVAEQLAKPVPVRLKVPRRSPKRKRALIAVAVLITLVLLAGWVIQRIYYWGAAQVAFTEGNAAGAASRMTDAVSRFSEAINLQPQFGRAYAQRGYAYLQLGQLSSAKRDLDAAIRLEPGIAADLYVRSDIEARQGEHLAAIRDLSEAIRLAPGVSDYYYWRSSQYFSINNYRSALTDLTECIRLRPGAYTYYLRGVAYSRLLDYADASTDLDRAIAMDATNPDAFKERAILDSKLGRPDLATRDRLDAVRLYKARSDYLQSIGNHPAAEEAQRQMRELELQKDMVRHPAGK